MTRLCSEEGRRGSSAARPPGNFGIESIPVLDFPPFPKGAMLNRGRRQLRTYGMERGDVT